MSWFVRNETYAYSASNAGANPGGEGSAAVHFTVSGNVTAACGRTADKTMKNAAATQDMVVRVNGTPL